MTMSADHAPLSEDELETLEAQVLSYAPHQARVDIVRLLAEVRRSREAAKEPEADRKRLVEKLSQQRRVLEESRLTNLRLNRRAQLGESMITKWLPKVIEGIQEFRAPPALAAEVEALKEELGALQVERARLQVESDCAFEERDALKARLEKVAEALAFADALNPKSVLGCTVARIQAIAALARGEETK